MFNLAKDRITICKTEAALNDTSSRLRFQKTAKSTKINLLKGTVMQMITINKSSLSHI